MANFRKRIKLLPGVRLNVSKSGLSMSAGIPGLSVTIGKKGTYLNTGIPGTGIYERKKISGGSSYTVSTPSILNKTNISSVDSACEQDIEDIAVELVDSELYPTSKENIEAIVKFILQDNSASMSRIKLNFNLGYAETGRIIDFLEACGIVSEQYGSKAREILTYSLQDCYIKINDYISSMDEIEIDVDDEFEVLYYYSIDHENESGPVRLSELVNQNIRSNTLIWHEGLDEWKEAKHFPELQDCISSKPPTLCKK